MKAVDQKDDWHVPFINVFILIIIVLFIGLMHFYCDTLFSTQNTDFHKKAINGELLPDSTR